MENENRPHFKPGAVKYTKGYGTRLVMSKIIKFLMAIMVIFVAISSVYIFVKQPVKTENGHVLAEVNHKSFSIEDDVIIVVDDNYNLFTPLKRALLKTEVYEAKIIAGPYGEFKGDNTLVYGEFSVEVNVESTEDGYLDNEYIVRSPQRDKDIIVKKENILGLKIKN